ncbi:MAG: hypothetical protein ACYTFG_17840, partial [Planctomycetota bacterium]
CPTCGKIYKLDEGNAGKKFKCTRCTGTVSIPEPTQEIIEDIDPIEEGSVVDIDPIEDGVIADIDPIEEEPLPVAKIESVDQAGPDLLDFRPGASGMPAGPARKKKKSGRSPRRKSSRRAPAAESWWVRRMKMRMIGAAIGLVLIGILALLGFGKQNGEDGEGGLLGDPDKGKYQTVYKETWTLIPKGFEYLEFEDREGKSMRYSVKASGSIDSFVTVVKPAAILLYQESPPEVLKELNLDEIKFLYLENCSKKGTKKYRCPKVDFESCNGLLIFNNEDCEITVDVSVKVVNSEGSLD